MIEEVMALIFLPLLVGSTIGSMYFLVSSVGKHSWIVLGVLFVVSWFLGYASGFTICTNHVRYVGEFVW